MSKGKIGDELRKYRILHYLTQGSMAELLGVPKRTYEDWEYGMKKPSAAARKMLTMFLESKNE